MRGRGVWTIAGLLSAAVVFAGGSAWAADEAARCPALAQTKVPASAFGLPTSGADISEAILVAADAAKGTPEYCRVRGAIRSAHAGEPSILFQVNLPTSWNRKTVMYGGGGTNGVVIDATGPFAGGGGEVPTALAQGYVSYGSDSGHEGQGREFFDDPEQSANYAYAAVKRSKDVATALVRAYYGVPALRNYEIGGSKGGQEGLQAAERYGADFDGVVAYYPAQQRESLELSWNRLWAYTFGTPGGAIDTAKQNLLKSAVLDACDKLDGAADGIVSNTAACLKTFDVEKLRCPGGRDTGDSCLSDPQIAALKVAETPFRFAHPMPNGVTTVGPWPAFLGGDIRLWLGDGTEGSEQAFYRATSARAEAMKSSGIDAATWDADVTSKAKVFDASNPDLDTFHKRGGKLLLLQGTTDMLVPTAMTTHYFQRLSARYGHGLSGFVRYYIIPGYGHGFGAFTTQWNGLAALDAWVETGKAPEHPIAADGAKVTAGRTRPICEYPTWPKYVGTGDVNQAANFVCVTK